MKITKLLLFSFTLLLTMKCSVWHLLHPSFQCEEAKSICEQARQKSIECENNKDPMCYEQLHSIQRKCISAQQICGESLDRGKPNIPNNPVKPGSINNKD